MKQSKFYLNLTKTKYYLYVYPRIVSNGEIINGWKRCIEFLKERNPSLATKLSKLSKFRRKLDNPEALELILEILDEAELNCPKLRLLCISTLKAFQM